MRRIAIKLLIDYEYVPVVTGCVLDYLSHTLNVRRGDRRSSIAPGAADITGDVPNLLDVGGALFHLGNERQRSRGDCRLSQELVNDTERRLQWTPATKSGAASLV